MKLNRVIVVYKKHARHVRGEARLDRLHASSIAAVERGLHRKKIRFSLIERSKLKRGTRADFVIAVGGDGTVLAAAHATGGAPILGVNSMPGYSVGFFCAADAGSFDAILSRIISGSMRQKRLPLIEPRIDGKQLDRFALNDVLFAGACPAETARYTLAVGKKREHHRSSGVWIAAGPGSTAAIHSAGGRRFSVKSKKLQFVVREPYSTRTNRFRLTRGVLPEGGRIKITSGMRDGMLFIDGHSIAYPIASGETLTVSVSRRTLPIYL